MIDNELLNKKIENAISVTEALIQFLKTVELNGWADRYSKILAYLKEGDHMHAIELLKSFSYGGPGSLSDIWLEDDAQKRFNKLVGAQSATIGNIRLFLSYGANRPLVVIEDVL